MGVWVVGWGVGVGERRVGEGGRNCLMSAKLRKCGVCIADSIRDFTVHHM